MKYLKLFEAGYNDYTFKYVNLQWKDLEEEEDLYNHLFLRNRPPMAEGFQEWLSEIKKDMALLKDDLLIEVMDEYPIQESRALHVADYSDDHKLAYSFTVSVWMEDSPIHESKKIEKLINKKRLSSYGFEFNHVGYGGLGPGIYGQRVPYMFFIEILKI